MKGTVFKRCTSCGRRVQQRRCGHCSQSRCTWSIRVRTGKDAKGRWIERWKGGFPTRRDAERALAEVVASVNAGRFVPTTALTVADYIVGEWLPATRPPHVKYETWNDRRRNLETHVIPALGAIRLQDLNASHINRLYSDLLQHGLVRGPGGLSATTVRRIHAMLRKAFNDAIRWGHLEDNPVRHADPPPTRAVRSSARASMQTWTPQELRAFLESTREHELGVAWLFTSHTGVRRSELLGLRWADVDFTGHTVAIRQTVVAKPGGYHLLIEQKSIASGRTLHLDTGTLTRLKSHREMQDRTRGTAGPAWHDYDLVFPRSDGTWWNPPAVSLAFGRAVRRAGVPRIRLQDVRHTHATLLLAAGINPKVVSERLGHSSVAFTLDTYAHVMPGMQPEAAETFRRLVFGENPAKGPVEEEAA